MAWWKRLLNRKANSPRDGDEFRVAFKLYSRDGQREVEVREFRNGQTYLVERERVEGAPFADRHSGRMVGPFASPEVAEKFICGYGVVPRSRRRVDLGRRLMKVALILDRHTTEQVVADADAYWLIASPENRKLAERLRQTDTFDPNSAVFDGDRYASAADAAVRVLDIIDEHHPQWTEVDVVGVELSSFLRMTLQDAGWAAGTRARGFVVTRAL